MQIQDRRHADWLRAAGLRVTAPRMAVLAVLEHDGHPTVEDIAHAVRRRLGAVSTQAIYDVLHALQRHGLIRHVEPAGHPSRYETRVDDNHHHFICRECGAVADVDCAVGEAPCLLPADDPGYLIDEAEVTYWGRCANCRRA
ncbi:Fur family transcriptional regulator [Pseudonocardia asaccharolytica]|uniref:Transcriptional repressor n=1 Tax=Pseudonocardia asaccharolytica DSM 44247 = NBRC 16224 TaxID=1123024 RepID=A0A511D7P2_9PSEU|nr:Fur family transcriptional regulator [Pseudonocardia asaccharolytica]GEL20433.1 transcriptional repressor [Pseudonocardia asaccharolytica DSM 44247 = NBRC 16224]